jgi:hypothetical protein
MFKGYTFAGSSGFPIVQAMLKWAWLELSEGWRSWGRRGRAAAKDKALTSPAPSLASH